jgi:hypothetical protein
LETPRTLRRIRQSVHDSRRVWKNNHIPCPHRVNPSFRQTSPRSRNVLQ